jgi:hypothetical protein
MPPPAGRPRPAEEEASLSMNHTHSPAQGRHSAPHRLPTHLRAIAPIANLGGSLDLQPQPPPMRGRPKEAVAAQGVAPPPQTAIPRKSRAQENSSSPHGQGRRPSRHTQPKLSVVPSCRQRSPAAKQPLDAFDAGPAATSALAGGSGGSGSRRDVAIGGARVLPGVSLWGRHCTARCAP